eukprot:c2866_g1_i1.p1 GENE.c2866_g1_i1~~c2866_g1_i1.p1  ORF type:complete len:182 (-),score=21.52 c2866_g1_i1:643-1188(-)
MSQGETVDMWEVSDQFGNCTLALLVEEGKVDEVGTFLENQAELNRAKAISNTDPQWRLMHNAAHSNNEEMVNLLVNLGFDDQLNHLSGRGVAPLHVAVKHGSLRSVEALLRHGADPNQKNKSGDTPLHCAAKYPERKHRNQAQESEPRDQAELRDQMYDLIKSNGGREDIRNRNSLIHLRS